MSLVTSCPRCASQFRVRPEQLVAGAGWVQCGVCGATFDARASLVPETAPVVEPAETQVSPAPVEPAEVRSAAVPGPPPVSEEFAKEAAPAGILNRQAARSEGPELTSIIVVDPDAPIPEEPEALPAIEPLQESSAPVAAVAAVGIVPAPARASEPPKAVVYPEEATQATAPRPPLRGVWASLALLLLVVLAAQGVYFQRDALVQSVPALRPSLQQMCAWMGCRLALPHDISSLAIIGSELQVSSRDAHRATLRVTLANQGDSVQAWPNLKLSLQGLDGRTEATETLPPEAYLHDATLLQGGVPPQSQHTLRVELHSDAVRLLAAQPYTLEIYY